MKLYHKWQWKVNGLLEKKAGNAKNSQNALKTGKNRKKTPNFHFFVCKKYCKREKNVL